MSEMCQEWLNSVDLKDARAAMRYFLRRALQPDGSIQMTKGYSSDLTEEFTNILSSSEAFTRDGVLTIRQKDICLARFAQGMKLWKIAKAFHYSRQVIDRDIRDATDKLLSVCCENGGV